jgi:hypothetical protein
MSRQFVLIYGIVAGVLALAGLLFAIEFVSERPSPRIDTPSLILIAVISCLCLMASLWAAFSGADLGPYWLWHTWIQGP